MEREICERWARLEAAVLEPVISHPPPPLGEQMRRQHFASLGGSTLLGLQPTEHYLNQGGTGMVHQAILQLQQLVAQLAEEQPMSYHREIGPVLMRRACEMVAAYLGASPENLSFVASASSGFYSVMQAMSLEPGDIILTSSLRYHSFDDDLQYLCESKFGGQVEIRTVHLALPIASSSEIVAAFTAAFDAAAVDGSLARIRLAFFDHVSSKPAVLFPVEALCALCRERGVPSLVDGAHAPGLLRWAGEAGEADEAPGSAEAGAPGERLDRMNPDYYVANFYKWMHAPRACACLYTNGKRWPHIRASSLNVTLEFDGTIEAGSGMETQAIYAGIYDESTRDYSPFLTLPGALALLRWLKPPQLRVHGESLARWGSDYLQKLWWPQQPQQPQPVAPELSTSMVTAELPLPLALIKAVVVRHSPPPGGTLTDPDPPALLSWAKTVVHRTLLDSYRIECPVFVHEGRLYVRASCALYNHRDDLVALGEAVLAVRAGWEAEEGGGAAAAAAAGAPAKL